MFKKIALGVVTVAVVGLLVAGAVNRTNVKLGDTESAGGRGRVVAAEPAQVLGGETGGRGGWGAGGSGQGASQAVVPPLAADVTTVQGTVTSADSAKLVLALADGTALELGGQPWRYALSTGFTAAAGDAVTLAGYWDGDHFEAVRLTHSGSNVTAVLRADDGTPKWSGRGRTN